MKDMYVVKTLVTDLRVPWTVAVVVSGHLTGDRLDQAVYSATLEKFRAETTYPKGTTIVIKGYEGVDIW